VNAQATPTGNARKQPPTLPPDPLTPSHQLRRSEKGGTAARTKTRLPIFKPLLLLEKNLYYRQSDPRTTDRHCSPLAGDRPRSDQEAIAWLFSVRRSLVQSRQPQPCQGRTQDQPKPFQRTALQGSPTSWSTLPEQSTLKVYPSAVSPPTSQSVEYQSPQTSSRFFDLAERRTPPTRKLGHTARGRQRLKYTLTALPHHRTKIP
jgi:hypothetical protein